MTYSGAPAVARPVSVRWLQLLAGIICMVMIANLQYGWTLFVAPMNKAHGWAVADIQIAFSIFVALETWLTPIQGWIADRLGPKFVVAAGGILVAAGWILNAYADALWILYLGAAITGTGAGAVYATCVGNSVKWFPDRRGLAVGLTAAGFGAGAALTVIPIRAVIAADGYAAAFFWFGLIQGVVVFLLAWLLRAPAPGETPATAPARVIQTTRSYTPQEILRSPVFWVLYVMFVLVSASGLMATAQIALIARDFGVANTVLLWGGTTLTIALLVDNICNGAARPLFGWISDHIGREYTMALAFGLGGISYWLLGSLGTAPWAFVLFAGLIFLTWGEIFSLFPSTCTDSFGPRYATANLSLLYTAKGVSAFLVPVANLIKSSTGSWHMVFVVTAAMNFLVVVLALFVLRPLRSRQLVAPVPEFAAVQRPT
ncbi:MAG: oxalate/formate MFS antiporter [Alphaproteobacteria bacterium]|nr:oxalate/formate MFS antiporter [Alphaproteobacteria bacterium]MBV9814191.1 oxalate/formate MFS antiporter [Alphaproteobacteria bacterium]